MNYQSLALDRFLIDVLDSDLFIRYDIGQITKEEYLDELKKRDPDIRDVGFIVKLDVETRPRVVPLCYDASGIILVGTLREWYEEEELHTINYKFPCKLIKVPISTFTQASEKYRDKIKILSNYSAKVVFELVTQDAIDKGAIEITFESREKHMVALYNIKLQHVLSPIAIPHSVAKDLYIFLTATTGTYNAGDVRYPIRTGIDINNDWRGRIELNSSLYGYLVTIRLINKRAAHVPIENLSYLNKAKNDIKELFMNKKPGLKLIAGPTLSGKNTAMMAVLSEFVKGTGYKCVSVENPIEQVNKDIIQLDTETEEEYAKACESLIRHNPDIVYATEINGRTALEIMKITNTGKAVFSTLHANGTVEVITRLQDLTGMPLKRICYLVDTIVYQRLVKGPKGLIPLVAYMHLDRVAHRKISMLEDDDQVLAYLHLKSTKFNHYVLEAERAGLITEDQRKDLI